MTFGISNSNTLLELIQVAPAEETAIILPESGIRVSYEQLRDQVTAMADALASLGIKRGERVATSLPNGLAAIVSFLAASIAGTAAVWFAKTRSCGFSNESPRCRSPQSNSRMRGASQRSTNIEWCWKSNQRQKASKPRSWGQVVSSLNHPDNCSVKISLHSSRKAWLTSAPCRTRYQVDRWLPYQVPQGQFMTGWIGGVEPIQKRLLRLHYDRRPV
jgi:AMP-binding enzyme